jgi:uroporphyrinogen III methyltransferase / synthase
LFGDAMAKMKIASLSPLTSEAVGKLGLSVAAEANPYTIHSLIDSIAKASQ